MLHADLFRHGWHRAIDTFGITLGPIAENITTTTVDIRWELTEAGSGQVEYGTTSAYGSTTSEEPIGSGYSEHIQTITGLTQGQAYHYRVKSVSAASVTVYSSDQTFTMVGEPVASGRDTRDAPAVPTGSNVYTIPGTIASDGTGDVGGAINAWLNGLPDGATAVFTSTGTEGYQHGVDTPVATYRMVTGINITRDDLTLWGYGVKFKLDGNGGTHEASGVRMWRSGTLTVRGFEMEGTFYDAGTPSGHSPGMQALHGISSAGDTHVNVYDCWVHYIHGDGVFVAGWPFQDHAPSGFDIGYNRFELIGRNGVTLNQNDSGTAWIHHCYMGDTGLYNIDGEDNRVSTTELVNVLIEECDFGTFTWYLAGWSARSISFVFSYGSEALPHIADCGPVTVRNCSFAGTAPHVAAAKGTSNVGIVDQSGISTSDGDYHDVTVTGCDFTNVPAVQRSTIWWANIPNTRNVTLTDNTGLGALASRYSTTGSTGVTVSGNS